MAPTVNWEQVRLVLIRAKNRGEMTREDRATVALAMTADVHRFRALRQAVRDGRDPVDNELS